MYWAGDRLGNERVKGAYAYKQLLNKTDGYPWELIFRLKIFLHSKLFMQLLFEKMQKDGRTMVFKWKMH